MDDRSVTGRVVAVLDAVAARDQPVSLAELTRDLGLPKPTVRRIAAGLVARKMLQRCSDGRYRLGRHLLDLGTRAAVQHGLLQAATPHVQELFARTGEIVWVCLAGENAVTFMGSAFGVNRAPDVRRGAWPNDLRSAAFQISALGRVLLADRPELVDGLGGRPPAPQTPHGITSWPRFLAEIEAVRDTGIATEHQQCLLGFSCVATGLRGPDGSLVGCIGITGHTSSLPVHRVVRPLLDAAQNIGRCAQPQSPRHLPPGQPGHRHPG